MVAVISWQYYWILNICFSQLSCLSFVASVELCVCVMAWRLFCVVVSLLSLSHVWIVDTMYNAIKVDAINQSSLFPGQHVQK